MRAVALKKLGTRRVKKYKLKTRKAASKRYKVVSNALKANVFDRLGNF